MPYLTPNTPPANRFICRRLRIPASADFLALVTGALASLIYEKNYEPHGSYSPADTAQAFKRMLADMETGDCMIGEIKAFMRETLPDNCLPCDGSVYNRADYPDLYAVLPAMFRLDADTFVTPNLTERGLVGNSGSLGTQGYNVGEEIGAGAIQLTEAQLAPHTHTNSPHSHTDTGHAHTYNNAPGITIPVPSPGEVVALAPSLIPGVTNLASAVLTSSSITIDPAGEGEPIDIRNPDTVILWGIVAR